MISIVVLTNYLSSLPALDYFNAQGWLKAVVSTDKLHAQNLQVEDYCHDKKIPFCKVTKTELPTKLKKIFTEAEPDVVLMFGFSYRIPSAVFTVPPMGFYNVHFSLLPAYRGPNPVFWQMKNCETIGGVTIHKVNEDFDAGAVVMRQQLQFMPGETSGICDGRHGAVAVNMMVQLIEKLKTCNLVEEIPVEGAGSYYPKPTADELIIKWYIYTAQQIESLVNACNPEIGGALTTFKQQMVRILEVSPVDGMGEEAISPGTIIHADANGLYVQCVDRHILRINILKLNEGYITGFKLAALGVQRGDRFEEGVFSTRNLAIKLNNLKPNFL